jgi:hypothetical protein
MGMKPEQTINVGNRSTLAIADAKVFAWPMETAAFNQ